MHYNKLVRDLIPAIIQANGDSCKIHIAEEIEYWQKLKEKLREESEEFIEDESEEEFVDLLEIIEAIYSYKNFDRAKIEELRLKKRVERGGFEKRIILDETN